MSAPSVPLASSVRDEGKAPPPSSSAAHPEPVVCCNAMLDELRGEELQLKLIDLCPVCHVMVARHQRLPLGTSPLPTGSSAYSRSSTQLGKNTTLPQWKLHGNVHAKPFLDKVEHLLLADDVDRKAWPRLLLKAVPNVHDSSWVKLNIVEANVDWSTARHLFTAQFEVLTWTEQSQQLYEQCRQGAREPVQEYSHRFMTCVTELQHEDDDQHVILHFQLGLIPSIQAKIRDRVHLYRDLQKQLSGFSNGSLTSSAPYTIQSLKQMTDLAINIERSAQVSSSMLASGAPSLSASPSTSAGSASTPSSFGPKKSCIHHPNSNSHSTADCRLSDSRDSRVNGKGSPSATGHLPSGLSPTSGSAAAAIPAVVLSKQGNPVKCYVCGGNHYANDNACPRRSDRSTRSGSKPSALTTSISSLATRSVPVPLSASTPAPIQGHAVSLPALSAAPTDTEPGVVQGSAVSLISVDRSLTAAAVIPTHRTVYLMVSDRVYSTLVDTGAEVSFVDSPLVTSWAVSITPPVAGSKIRLAQVDVLTDRSGSVELDATALFPCSDRDAISFRARFEIMPVHGVGNEHHFIIGRDLIPVLFPAGIPLAYLPQLTSSAVTVAASSALVDSLAVSSDSSMLGSIPSDDQPDRILLSTPEQLEAHFAASTSAHAPGAFACPRDQLGHHRLLHFT